jgi:hypothetical protein
LLALVACGFVANPFLGPKDIKVAHPAQAVRDARELITEYRQNPGQKPPLREPKDLPESLRLPNLRYAIIRDDHLNLVLSRDPDVNLGARIWSADSKREHHDRPTSYPDIFFYSYNNDYAETPDNIP